MPKSAKIFLILAAAAVLFWLGAAYVYGSGNPLLILIFLALTAVTLWAARKLPLRAWLLIGLVFLVGLFLPTGRIIQNLNTPPEPVNSLVWAVLFCIPILALIIAALLIYSALSTDPVGGRETWAALALSGLLIARVLYSLYWLTVWDNTYDPLTYLWLVVPGLAAVSSAIVLVALLPGKRKLAGLVMLLLPFAMVAVSAAAQHVNNRQVTAARAAQVALAIERYHAREGRYPQSLRQLVPWHVLWLPGPLVLYGQDWCYAGGQDVYRLGYLERTEWFAPVLNVRVAKTSGDVHALPPPCAAETAALMKNLPGYWSVSVVSP